MVSGFLEFFKGRCHYGAIPIRLTIDD